ncbi:hypothetical protein, partial [Aeromonas caviae]|uniref:hypothetical protein n=1 Tax=Aeromonas caviae TaxID=648 RepID=UPI001CC64ACB
ANVRSFLERDDVQAILKRAERVTVAGENEKNPDAQATVTRSARFRIACTSSRSKKLRTFAPPDTMTVGGCWP